MTDNHIESSDTMVLVPLETLRKVLEYLSSHAVLALDCGHPKYDESPLVILMNEIDALIRPYDNEPEPCPHCNGEHWHMARMDSVWFPATVVHPEDTKRLCWNACEYCNQDGQLPVPTITYEEYLRRKRGE